MSQKLILTEAGYFIVTNDVPDDFDFEDHEYNKMRYAEFLETSQDDPFVASEATELLNEEFPPQSFPFRFAEFKNDLSQLPPSPNIDGYTVLSEYDTILDDDFDKMSQRLGYTIEKDVRNIYVEFDEYGSIRHFDENKQEIDYFNDDYLGTCAFVITQKYYMRINMPRYILKNEDYEIYLNRQQHGATDGQEITINSIRDGVVHDFIDNQLNNQKSKRLDITHEMKHQRNRFFRERLQLKSDAKQLSCEDIYKINVEDERSATLSEVIFAINNYFKTGNKDLLNACPQGWLKNILKEKSNDELKAILTDHSFIVNECLKEWNDVSATGYVGQFRAHCYKDVKAYCSLPSDDNHEEFNKQLSAFYTFEVYNPKTGKTEYKNLSNLINVEVDVDETAKDIIKNSEEKRKEQKLLVDLLMEDPQSVTYQLISEAKNFLREKIRCMDNAEDSCLLDIPNDQNASEETNTSEPKSIQQENKPEQENPSVTAPENKPITSVEENIPDPVTTPDSNNQPNKDFAEPYREFYQNLAKKEKSQYSEDESSPYYKATLVRKDNSELNIVATPDSQVSLGAKDKNKKDKIPDYEDFENLALLAKKQGKSITFGDIKTPEFKARLMLACLENDVKMKNIPNFSELKGIEPQTMQRLKDKLKERNSTKGNATAKGGEENPNVQVLPQAAKFSPLMGHVLKQKGGR